MPLYLGFAGCGNDCLWATLLRFQALDLRFELSELTDPPEYAKSYLLVYQHQHQILVLLPIVIDLQFKFEIVQEARWVSAWFVLVGAETVSSLPTFAGKGMKLPVSVLPVLALLAC